MDDMSVDRQVLDILPHEYHERPEISHSGIKCFAKEGPLMFHARYVARTVQAPDSGAKRLGRVFHLAMSDPKSWVDFVEIRPDTLGDDEDLYMVAADWAEGDSKAPLTPGSPISNRYPAHREYLERRRQRAEREGKEFISEEELIKVTHMVASVYENPAALEYVGKGGLVEKACIAKDRQTGLGLRALVDLWLDDIVVDFKTTRHTTANGFVNEALNKWSYNYQAEWYLRVTGARSFKIISVRNDPPFESMVYTVPRTIILATREANDYHLQALKECFETDSWHSLYWGSELDLGTGERYAQ